MPYELHDHYFREARREGYLSRAAYKLIEIDDRKRVLRHGDRVLDLGCAPGSWLQVASRRVGRRGIVVGVDMRPLGAAFPPTVRIVEGDVFEVEPAVLLEAAGGGRLFDVILSDVAPNTSGSHVVDHHQSLRLCQRVLDLCPPLLRPGGRLVMKVFEGEGYPALLQRARRCFEKVKGFKPKASRDFSTEMYMTAEGYAGKDALSAAPPEAGGEEGTVEVEIALPKGRPSTGWKK